MGLDGPMGPEGPTGPTGATGPQGPTGVVATIAIAGNIAPLFDGGSSAYVFVGPPGSVTITGSQRVTGSASAPLGLRSSSAAFVAPLGLCYQRHGGGELVNFFGGIFTSHYFTPTRTTYSVSATTLLTEGEWNVGMCLRNEGTSPIQGSTSTTGNGFVNGWFIVTND